MTITKICIRCKQPFETPSFDLAGVTMSLAICCTSCSAAHLEDSLAREREAEQKRVNERWYAICPPLYRETDITHSGIQASFRDAALAWEPSSTLGLGFIGGSGGGKTRMLMVALRKAFDAGLSTRFLSHNGFSKLVIDAFSNSAGQGRSEAKDALSWLARVRVLFLDDLGKAPSTERCDAELEELIELRGANFLPTLWSANGTSEWLIRRFGPDRGEPLVRRLGEFSTVIKGD